VSPGTSQWETCANVFVVGFALRDIVASTAHAGAIAGGVIRARATTAHARLGSARDPPGMGVDHRCPEGAPRRPWRRE
jgi:hypothetical protein